MSLFSAGVLDYWTRNSVDQINLNEMSFLIEKTLMNNCSLGHNYQSEEDSKLRLDELRILLNIIQACLALSSLRLIYEIVYLKISQKMKNK